MARHMAEIALPAAAASPAGEALVEQRVVELGAGAGHRTHPLVIAMAGHAARTTYSPTDISPSALEENRRYFDATCGATAGLRFEPLVGTHEVTTQAAAAAQRGGGGGGGGGGVATTFMFMGSSLGNYFDGEIVGLLQLILGAMGPRDRLLLGVDRCHGPRKPAHIIHTAYNDAAVCYKKSNTPQALLCYKEVVSIHIDLGRFTRCRRAAGQRLLKASAFF